MRPERAYKMLTAIMVLGVIQAVAMILIGLALILAPGLLDNVGFLGYLNATMDYGAVWGGALVGGILAIAVGLVTVWAAVMVRRYSNAARITMVVIGILSLLNFPVGTALGILCIWVLLADRETVGRFRNSRYHARERMVHGPGAHY